MTSIPAADHGLTDPLDALLGDRLSPVLQLVDRRAGVRVDDSGITVRGLLRTHHTSWDRVERIELDNRLDVLLAAATRFLPVRRLPVVGGLLTDGVRSAASAATRRLVPGTRQRLGWVVATIHRDGLLHRDIDVDGGAWLTAVLSPSLNEAVQAHAAMRHIPVDRS
jgi:hypothetical protein